MHQNGKLGLLGLIVVTGVLALPVAAHADDVRHLGANSAWESRVLVAQSAAPASIFSPWSSSDVRMGAGTQAAPAAATGGVKPDTFPKDVRRSSEQSKDAIPVFQRSGRDDLEDIRTGSRPQSERTGASAARAAPREPFITFQPFSDVDVRQGSRRQQSR